MFNHENSTAEQRTNLNESSVNILCMLHLLDPPSVGARKVSLASNYIHWMAVKYMYVCYSNIKRKTVIYFYNGFNNLQLTQIRGIESSKTPVIIFFGTLTWYTIFKQIIQHLFKIKVKFRKLLIDNIINTWKIKTLTIVLI